MFAVDHVAVWLKERDAALARLADATGRPILEGYAPEGRRVARGLRFCNGPFIDLHRSEVNRMALLALRGSVGEAAALAQRCGWRSRVTQQVAGGEPWSILSFARGQGVLSLLFVIQYADDPMAWASPVYNGGLYHRPPEGGLALEAVRITASDLDRADRDLRLLGFPAEVGGRYVGGGPDLLVSAGEDGVVGLEIEGADPRREIPIGPTLTARVGAGLAYRRG